MDGPEIVTADGVSVKEGDRVFSHYTCTWGIIANPTKWGDDVWFDFVAEDGTGKRHTLNGERIASAKPGWMR